MLESTKGAAGYRKQFAALRILPLHSGRLAAASSDLVLLPPEGDGTTPRPRYAFEARLKILDQRLLEGPSAPAVRAEPRPNSPMLWRRALHCRASRATAGWRF